MTSTAEVLGIAVAATALGALIVQPWSQLERCIDMDVAPLPPLEAQPADEST